MDQSFAGAGLDFSPTRGHEIKRGAVAALPVVAGFVPFALVLGAQATQKGLQVWQVSLLTGLNFGGGSEFAAIALWTLPPQIVLLVAVTFMVNSRHLLMGAVLAPLLKNRPKRQTLAALFFMCDESWAMGLADAQQRQKAGLRDAFSMPYYMGVALVLYGCWIVFTALGAVLGPMLGDLEQWGFHMAFPAVFLVLLRGMWKGFVAARPWLVSLVVAIIAHYCLPGAWYVAAGAAAGMAAAWWWAKEPA